MNNHQVVIIVLAFISALVLGIPAIGPFFKDLQQKGLFLSLRDDSSTIQTSKILDLAFVLICASFYSLLLVDALLISGRSYSVISSALITTIISIILMLSLVFMWYRGRAELGIAWWAMVTLALLIFADGGPFAAGMDGTPDGINLWMPVPALVFLAVTMWVYVFGHPLDKTNSRFNRNQVRIVVLLIVVIAVVALGRQNKNYIENDDRTPDIRSENTKNLIEDLNTYNWNVTETRIFYAAASDAHIIDEYESRYRNISGEVADLSEANEQVLSPVNSRLILLGFAREDAAAITEVITSLEGESVIQEYLVTQQNLTLEDAANIASIATLAETAEAGGSDAGLAVILRLLVIGVDRDSAIEINDAIVSLEGEGEVVVQNYLINNWGFSPDTAVDIARFASFSSGSNLNELYIVRLNQLISYFENLSERDQIDLLAHRLLWIHPTGLPEQEQPVIPLPGITAKQRFEDLSLERMKYALGVLPNQREALLSEFVYDERIQELYAQDPLGLAQFQPLGPFESLVGEEENPALFPDLGSADYVRRLTEQLSLPTAYEAYIAYSQYQITARQIQKDIFQDHERNPIAPDDIDEILLTFEGLDSDQKEAFVRYLIEDENRDAHFEALYLLAQIDLSAINDQPDEAILRQLYSYLEPENRSNANASSYAQIIDDILTNNPDDVKLIQDLFDIQNPNIPVHNLMFNDVLQLVTEIQDLFEEEQRHTLFEVINNPISIVIPEILKSGITEALQTPANPAQDGAFRAEAEALFNGFKVSEHLEQQSFLHALALDLYQASGPNAHNAFSLLISQAAAWLDWAGLIVASVMVSPFVFLVAITGLYASRRLTARDRLRDLVVSEASQRGYAQYALGMTDHIRGRDDVISQLKNLAGRGWSSIAIVGRRGVGKTRVLYQLLRGSRHRERPTSITAWVAAPSKFEEAEFVESVLERLTADIENAISICLGAKPLEVRRLETNAMLTGVAIYVVFVMILILDFILIAARVSGQIITTWFPIFIVFMSSVIALILHITHIQPIDLSPWLERDRSSNPHTVLLYREARRSREFLDERRSMSLNPRSKPGQWISFFRVLGIISLALIFLLAVLNIWNAGLDMFSVIFVISSGFLLAGIIRLRTRSSEITRGYTLMSLVSEYRNLVERTVYRIRQGALGDRPEDDFEIIVCIDELDKIIDPDELRDFLRRMKVILEIPGAYYYLSLSEDALQSLYLGAAEGKNEIDSTFDHIVRIPPVDINVGTEIATSYVQKNANTSVDHRIGQMISAISFGVPRDIIRRADEVLAQGNITQRQPQEISDDFRRRQAHLAFGEHLLTKQAFLDYSEEAPVAANKIKDFLKDELNLSRTPPRTIQVILSLWVLALLSVAATLPDDMVWMEQSEKLSDIGYRILDESAKNLIDELIEIHNYSLK